MGDSSAAGGGEGRTIPVREKPGFRMSLALVCGCMDKRCCRIILRADTRGVFRAPGDGCCMHARCDCLGDRYRVKSMRKRYGGV